METTMTEMEQDYAGQIMDYAFSKIQSFLNNEDMVNSFWNEYFQTCTMSTPETGLEMPHEEDLSYTYHPNADEYNSRYGW